jgi:hypothetical protein
MTFLKDWGVTMISSDICSGCHSRFKARDLWNDHVISTIEARTLYNKEQYVCGLVPNSTNVMNRTIRLLEGFSSILPKWGLPNRRLRFALPARNPFL